MSSLRSFTTKLVAIFLMLVILAGVASVLIALRVFDRRQVEIDQRLNHDIAESMAAEIEPVLTSSKPDRDIGSIMHYMMVMNPAVEIYLLDAGGRILDYFVTDGPKVELDRVSVAPITAFLERTRPLPIYGDNPRRPNEKHHFSAARIDLGDGDTGYLYVVLRSSEYESASMGLQQRYVLHALRTSAFITVPIVGVLGLLVFFLATRPLKQLAETVQAFGTGAYQVRSSIDTRDEIGDLARNFNDMADTIVSNMSKLEHADRERRELIANISHDLRNPLATIQGYLETLSQKDPTLSAADRRHYYEILLNTTKSLPRLVEDLFELSKLDAPDARPAMEPFSLSELAQDVVMQWKPRAEDFGIALNAVTPEELHIIHGNVGMIERALVNLLRNALTHTSAGGSVTVSLHGSPAGVRLEVADTGPGILPGDEARVFDRFYISDASRSKARHGSGLGLAICRRIIELHCGTIGVKSDPGAGSVFYFDLPRSSKE